MNEKRSTSRNKVWPETEAVIKYRDALASRPNTIETLKENIDNLGSQGMFIKSGENITINTELDILIDFNPGKSPDISLQAEGVVLRSENEGFAIRFTKIDTRELGNCIMQKLDR